MKKIVLILCLVFGYCFGDKAYYDIRYPYNSKETFSMLSLPSNLSDSDLERISKNCQNKDAKECFKIGVLFVNNQYFDKNLTLALEFFDISCIYNEPTGCIFSGIISFLLNNNSADLFNYTKKACDINLNYCNDLGLLYMDGVGVEKEMSSAYYYLKKSCDSGNLRACKNIEILKKRIKHGDI